MSTEIEIDQAAPEYVLAKHLYDIRYREPRADIAPWVDLEPFEVEWEVNAARHALAAVEPLIHERIAQRVGALKPGASMTGRIYLDDAIRTILGATS